jgi:hypothetical protein
VDKVGGLLDTEAPVTDNFTSWRCRKHVGPQIPTVKWSGIQNVLEEAESDVLLLLDCCHSGTANTNEGRGVTELISAGAFNTKANGVGPYSFTNALILELEALASKRRFSTAELYNNIFCRIQLRMPEDNLKSQMIANIEGVFIFQSSPFLLKNKENAISLRYMSCTILQMVTALQHSRMECSHPVFAWQRVQIISETILYGVQPQSLDWH